VEVDGVEYDDLVSDSRGESSADVKKRADMARKIQRIRFENSDVKTNAEMGEKETREYCKLDKVGEQVLREAFESLRLSARARSRILKVARTIADLELSENILPEHLYEAISYRTYGAALHDDDL
jgi:magnesium chelatase family protein